MNHGKSGEGTTFQKFITEKFECPFAIKVRTPCGRSAPLHELLFCDYEKCLSMVHPIAALRDIENYFCSHCLRTWAPNIIRKYTHCPKCICCPACFSTCEKVLMMRSETYLLQCTFCWWLSQSVGIKAKTAQELIQMITMSDKDEVGRLQTEVSELVKFYGKNIKDKVIYIGKEKYHPNKRWYPNNILEGSGQNAMILKDRSLLKRKPNYTAQKSLPGEDPQQVRDACAKRDRKTEKKRVKQHDLPKKEFANAWVKPADSKFVSDIRLERVSSLVNRLEDPIRQPPLLDQLHPQRVRLMTKESFKCPDDKCNHRFLVKPQSGTRSSHFEVKKLAIDYLPHMRMEGPLDGWPTKDADEPASINFYIYFANPLNKPISIQVTPRANDIFSNTEIDCSGERIVIDKWDVTARTIWPPRKEKRMKGEFQHMNMLALPLTAVFKDRSCKRLQFILDIDLRCEICCSDGETRCANLRYPLEITVKRMEQKSTSMRQQTRTRHRKDSERRPKGGRPRSSRNPQSNKPTSMARKPVATRKTYNC